MRNIKLTLDNETRFLSDIDMLTYFNWNQRVLLVSTTGTGKTTLFERYAESTTKHKGVIICEPNQCTVLNKCEGHPNFGQWIDPKARTSDNRAGKVIYSTYDSFLNGYNKLVDREKYLVVFDESHNISELIGFRFNGFDLLDFLSTSSEYVFMTGTPRDELDIFNFDTYIKVENNNYNNRKLHFMRVANKAVCYNLIEEYVQMLKPDNIIIYKQSKNDNYELASKIESKFPIYHFNISHSKEKDKRILTKQHFEVGDSIATTSWLREGVDIITNNYKPRVLMFAFDSSMSAELPSTLIQLSERIRNPQSIDIIYFNSKDITLISHANFNQEKTLEYNAALYTKCYDIVENNNNKYNWQSDNINTLLKTWGWDIIRTSTNTISDVMDESYYDDIKSRIIERDFDTPFFLCGDISIALKDFGLNENNLTVYPPYQTIKHLRNTNLTSNIDEIKMLEYICNKVNIDYFDYVKNRLIDTLLKLNNMSFADVNYKITHPEQYGDITFVKNLSVYTSMDDFNALCKCNIFEINKYVKASTDCEFEVYTETNYNCKSPNQCFTDVKRIENYFTKDEPITTTFEVQNERFNTILHDDEINDLMRIFILAKIKLPWYVPTLEDIDESEYFDMMVILSHDKYRETYAGEIINRWKSEGCNHSHDFNAWYNRYKDLIANLDDINIASFIDVEPKYGVDDIFDGVVDIDYNAEEMYRIAFAVDNADKKSILYNFQKTRKDKGKAHKSHTFEYFIDDVRYVFEGKLNDLIEKLKTEIENCPKSINTIKKRYSIKKL